MSLNDKLNAALVSREKRLIRRRLYDPSADAHLADFSSNDYLSLSLSPALRTRFLAKLSSAPHILGSGGSRLLVNGHAHAALEARLAAFFRAPAALLFNSGFDANVGFFASVPQPGDAIVYDEHIHASVHDGMRASRAAARVPFAHNSPAALRDVLERLVEERPGLAGGENSVFVSVETLYSMDGTVAPLTQIVEAVEQLFPHGNGYVVVDEAHSTGVYGPQGRGLVAALGLEDRIFARLHTFGKALAATGAVLLVTPLVRDYLLNYARSLIYTTSLSNANIIAADCSFDMLEEGEAEKLSAKLLRLSSRLTTTFSQELAARRIPSSLLSLPANLTTTYSGTDPTRLPTPIIPVLTPHPRPLSAHLRVRGLNARPITWPTVPKGADRVRICLHSANTQEEVDRLVSAMVEWAESWQAAQEAADSAAVNESAGEPGWCASLATPRSPVRSSADTPRMSLAASWACLIVPTEAPSVTSAENNAAALTGDMYDMRDVPPPINCPCGITLKKDVLVKDDPTAPHPVSPNVLSRGWSSKGECGNGEKLYE
ncbi:pyridoxal phosphate-dependent transferase [Trametes elegans]|nr:pyridoxal phosphate-dependent transferase [Trametes elegans]